MENDILKRRMAVANNIAKSFGYDNCVDILEKAEDNDIEKARSGIYADTAENRKLGRVGQRYGSKKVSEESRFDGIKSKYNITKTEEMYEKDGSLKENALTKRLWELDKKVHERSATKKEIEEFTNLRSYVDTLRKKPEVASRFKEFLKQSPKNNVKRSDKNVDKKQNKEIDYDRLAFNVTSYFNDGEMDYGNKKIRSSFKAIFNDDEGQQERVKKYYEALQDNTEETVGQSKLSASEMIESMLNEVKHFLGKNPKISSKTHEFLLNEIEEDGGDEDDYSFLKKYI